MKERLLISACLLGFRCKYDGGTNTLPAQTRAALREKYDLHMSVERYVSAEENEEDERFIRK